jgi:hypothetical protein
MLVKLFTRATPRTSLAEGETAEAGLTTN